MHTLGKVDGIEYLDAIYGEYLSITEGIHKILNYTGE